MRLLADDGCIYTLGRQDGTVLRGNQRNGNGKDRHQPFIDEVRLYGRVLSASELQAHAASPAAITEPDQEKDLLGYWPFDEMPDLDQLIHKMRETVGISFEPTESLPRCP